jgi:hypothetical protein
LADEEGDIWPDRLEFIGNGSTVNVVGIGSDDIEENESDDALIPLMG